jgi:hypothetical protein
MTAKLACSEASLAAGEPLGATASEGVEWLLVEVRGAWGRDAVADSGLPLTVRETMAGFGGKVILVRRPDRRSGVTVIRASVTEGGGTAVRQELRSLEELPGTDVEGGDPVVGPIVLVCAHGRRDACCARLGVPLFDALAGGVPPERLWQASHLGGHRFAPNVLVLPQGVQLGRIPVGGARELVRFLAGGRIPLDLYRGRTIYPPPVQAAEVMVRSLTGVDRVTDLQLVTHEADLVTFATPAGELTVRVEERSGPLVPASCGVAPESPVRWVASLESAA